MTFLDEESYFWTDKWWSCTLTDLQSYDSL